nr:hypothetical protein GCM10020092_032650 [Actinoplanes digitatis]
MDAMRASRTAMRLGVERAEQHRVVVDGGDRDGALKRCGPVEGALDGGQQGAPAGLRDRAGEHHEARVEHCDHRGQADRDAVGELGQELARGPRVRGRGADRLGRGTSGYAVILGQGEHGRAADQVLQVDLAVGGVGGVQGHVADLARAAAGAAQQCPAGVDGQAEALEAEPEQGEAVGVAGHAAAAFGDRGEVDVVVDSDAGVQRRGDLRHQAGTPEAGHVHVPDGLGPDVVRAGDTELDVPDAVGRHAAVAA